MVEGRKILVTGATGHLARPVIRRLAPTNEVWGMARLRRAEDRETMSALGATPLPLDLAHDALDGVPDDFDFVFHAGAVVYTAGSEEDLDYTFELNAQATGRLMTHCRRATTFVHCSTGGVYRYSPQPVTESDPLGVTIGAYTASPRSWPRAWSPSCRASTSYRP